jgi:sugar phosphate isomerase/epimerase
LAAVAYNQNMTTPQLGIDLQDLRTDAKSALRQAAQMEFRAVELPAAEGETTPESLSSSGRRHLQRLVADLGLDMSALSADFPGLRLSDSTSSDERVERTGASLALAADMAVPLVTASVGALTHPQTGQPSDAAISALRRIGEFADSRDRIFAIRPSHDTVDRLAAVLAAVGCPWIRIGLDPAAMLMSGVNPLATMQRIGPQVSLIHMRDAVPGHPDHPGQETRLGEGEVDVRGLLAALNEWEYQGPLILRRTDSASPASDLASAREFLRRMM